MQVIEKLTKKEYTLDIPTGRTGNVFTFCPACRDDRKPGNRNKKPLSFDASKGVGECHNCGAIFFIPSQRENFRQTYEQKSYSKPQWKNHTELSDKVVKWFEGRGIKQSTLNEMKVTEGMEWMPQFEKEVATIQFNYFREGELVNIKYRGPQKSFKLYKDAELVLYNLDAIKDSKECLICEGEMDCLSWAQSGYKFAVSVPNGAQKVNQNLQYIDNCYDYLEGKEKIYISYDNDTPGLALKDELIRRLGAEKCFIIDLEGEKDANEYLQKYGNGKLRGTLEKAKEVPIEGVFTVNDFEYRLDDLYRNGMQPGKKIGHQNFDDLCSFETGRLCVVTGIPSHGKSEWVDEMLERLNIIYGWKAAYFSPENFPLEYHASKLIEKLTGKKFHPQTLFEDYYQECKAYLENNFSFIMPKDDQFTLDNILDKGRLLVRRKGIKVLVLDPWNRIESQIQPGENETKYISRQLIKMSNFARLNDILFILVAHPTKMQRMKDEDRFEVPTPYHISGSANFYNQPDYCLTVYRYFKEDVTQIHVQKVKFRHLGQPGFASMKYNINNGRFTPILNDMGFVDWDNSNHLYSKIEIQKHAEIDPNNIFEPVNESIQIEVPF